MKEDSWAVHHTLGSDGGGGGGGGAGVLGINILCATKVRMTLWAKHQLLLVLKHCQCVAV